MHVDARPASGTLSAGEFMGFSQLGSKCPAYFMLSFLFMPLAVYLCIAPPLPQSEGYSVMPMQAVI